MSVDRTKVLEAAQKFLAKGNYDRAIGELRRIVQADPTDVRTLLKIGDLYTRSGSRSEAIDTYARVAQQYGDQGFFLKAVAVYKQILKLDPSRLDIQIRLAEMYEMLQLVSDALSTYEHVASGYARMGDLDRALETLKKMTGLDPENIPIRIKAAEALSKAGRRDEAAAEFEAGATLLRDQGRFDDYLKVAERLLYHRPDDVELARNLSRTYLERDDPKRALSKLQLCFKADPKDILTLELLAEAFNQLGQLPKTISVYKEVARIHQEANRNDERARILKRVLELDPGDKEARQGLASFADGANPVAVPRDIQPPASAVVGATQVSGQAFVDDQDDYDDAEVISYEEEPDLEEVEVFEDEEDEDIVIVEEDMEPVAPAPAPAAAAPSRSIPPDVQREAQIARLLTECDVFMRYGLKQKVTEQLHAVLQIEPLHVEARERLKDIYIEDGRLLDAVAELISLADILAEEQSAAASLYLRQVLEIEPGNPEALTRLERLGGAPQSLGAPSAGDVFDVLPPPPSAEQASVEDEVFFLDDESGVDMASSSRVVPASPPPGRAPERTRMDVAAFDDDDLVPDAPPERTQLASSAMIDDEEDFGGASSGGAPSYDATVVAGRPALAPPPGPPGAVVSAPGAPRRPDPLAPMSQAEFDDVPLRPSRVAPLAPTPSGRPPGEVEETLDEADFFVAQGLVDEARAVLNDALSSYPNHPLILEKLREIGATPPSVAPASEGDSVDQSFELAEKLAQDFSDNDEETTSAGSDVLDVEQVFAQFKKGVEAQVGAEDTETHFDLGIAYKEMGLLDDAMNEFRLCLANPQRVCIAETMIGLCCIEKGELTDAITHFKKGLYADNRSDREELGLYYELGNAYELLRDPKEAIFYFQKVEKRDPDFRGVLNRIQNLSQPRAAAATPAAPQLGQDDIDAAFDDLMGED